MPLGHMCYRVAKLVGANHIAAKTYGTAGSTLSRGAEKDDWPTLWIVLEKLSYHGDFALYFNNATREIAVATTLCAL